MRFSASLSGVVMLAALILTASCAVTPVRAPEQTGREPGAAPEPGVVTPARLSAGKPCPAGTIALVNRTLSSVRSLEATLNMGISVDDPPFSTRVQAGLIADNESNFRLRAYLGPVCVLDGAVSADSVWAYLPTDALVLVGTFEEALRSAPDGELAYVLAAVSLKDVLFPSVFDPDSCRTFKLDRKTCQVEERVTRRVVGRVREIYARPGGEPTPAHLRFQTEVGERTGKVEPRSGRLKELRLVNDAGSLARSELTAVYSDYKRTADGVFPHRIAVEFPGLGADLNLSFDRVQVNPAIPADAFRMSIPDGVTALTFNQLGGQ
ncbi:MAG: DUF4292 domain-containing protein [Candidatus Eisenbacteria bacterium]|nr:DUF4292 domain-containing protein [Candidatus Eisenbacteria bacterium]